MDDIPRVWRVRRLEVDDPMSVLSAENPPIAEATSTLLLVARKAYLPGPEIGMLVDISSVFLASAAAGRPALLEGEVPTWKWLVVVACTLVACVTDLRAMRIPNWLTLPMLAAGLTVAAVADGGHGFLLALAAAAIAGAVFVFGYMAFGGGAGDAKLMMACGAWLGVETSILLMLTVTVAGFLQALIVAATRGGVASVPFIVFDGWYKVFATAKGMLRGRAPAYKRQEAAVDPEEARKHGWFPYAPAIFLGTVSAWWILVRFGGKA
jgi:Flp pilus assembly protein protease CpaA